MGKLIRRLQYLFRQRRVETELAEEIEFHRMQKQRRLEETGAPPDDAAHASRRALGNVALAREDARAVWIAAWLERLWQDVRYGCRVLVKNPGFSAVVVLTLALGIGANSAIFSVIQAVILRPLPYFAPDRLMMLWTDDVKQGLHEEPTSYLTIEDWRTESRRFADMAFFRGEHSVILGGDAPDRVLAEFVSANLFPLLGVAPMLGRTFAPDEQDRGDAVVVLSYGLWQRRFGGTPGVVGQTLTLDQRVQTVGLRVIGVMPRGFAFPNRDVQFWRPASVIDRERTQDRFRFVGRRYGVVGRLHPGVTVPQAQAEMTTIGQRLSTVHPSSDPTFPGFRAAVVPLPEYFTGHTIQSALWILMGAVGVVLLIACVNAANLLLARGASRARELAIRSSLGAGRARLLRQVLTETGVLTVVAGVFGLALAGAGIRLLATFAPAGIYPESASSYVLTDSVPVLARSAQPGIPRLDEISVDSTVLGFTLALSFLTTLLFGFLPAWRLSKADPNQSLKQGAATGGSRWVRGGGSAAVVVECALAVLLLAASGLLVRSLERLQAVDRGFRSDGVLLVRVSLAPVGQRSTGQGTILGPREVFYGQVFERLRAMPAVQGAGLITDLLVRGFVEGSIEVSDQPAVAAGELTWASVSPGFFETLHVPLRRGRFFTTDDTIAKLRFGSLTQGEIANGDLAPPVIVNESFVRRFVGDREPVGTRFRVGRDRFEIVGVAGDMRRDGSERPAVAEYFSPYVGETSEIAVRTSADPLGLAPSVRDAIRSIDKNAMVLSVTTLERRLGELNAPRQAQTWLLTAFASVALALAAIGIYGIVRYDVAQRRHEIAVRIALGARAPDMLRLIVGQGMIAPLAGAVIGLTGALWLTRVVSHLLFEISTTDPVTFGGVAAVVVGAALVACWFPARRASRIDPIAALRCE